MGKSTIKIKINKNKKQQSINYQNINQNCHLLSAFTGIIFHHDDTLCTAWGHVTWTVVNYRCFKNCISNGLLGNLWPDE